MSVTRQQLETWLKTIKIDAMSKVLDVGGSQKPVKPRLGHAGEGSKYTILDLEEPHENSLKPDIVCDLNKTFNEQEQSGFYVGGVYDFVLCFEVAEYWWNPYQALKNLNFFLGEKGKLYMSVPFIYPVHNPKHNDYLRYTDMGISKLLENAGFRVDELIPRKAKNYQVLRAFYDGEGMKASRDYGSHESTGWLIKATKI